MEQLYYLLDDMIKIKVEGGKRGRWIHGADEASSFI